MEKYDFSGWATKANLKCSDGRTIMKDAFKHNDGKQVPLVWNHQHNDVNNILGHAVLENREEGVYAYCKFNDSESGQTAKLLVQHGDVKALSIYANQLRQHMSNVLHGEIREVSLVLAGANPGASIQSVTIQHGEDAIEAEDEGIVYTGEPISLYHADADEEPKNSEDSEDSEESNENNENEETDTPEEIIHADGEKTIGEVWDGITKKLSEEEMNVIYAFIGESEDENNEENKENNEGDDDMKHNVFDKEDQQNTNVLSHSDQEAIIALAKTSGVGSLQQAIGIYLEDKGTTLKHGVDELETLFPEFKNIDPGAPELYTRDMGWVKTVMSKVKKSPFTRVRTRKADARIAALRAKGYKKGEQKTLMANVKLLGRQTEPQTIYIKDELNRDDIIDITDFSIVDYMKKIMRMTLDEEVAMAIMVGDRRDDGDPDKIHEDRVRPIWTDEELYTMHRTIDLEAAKKELQGSDTGVYFSDNFIYSEAIIREALYAREKYKGSGTPDFYCAPHLVNIMLLARDRDGHRMYNNKTDLAAALNVASIIEAEQFDGLTRTDAEGNTMKLLGIFVNLADYEVGATKGGEITSFNQFDIDFNKEKFLMECRISGALVDPYSAIALEELVSTEAEG